MCTIATGEFGQSGSQGIGSAKENGPRPCFYLGLLLKVRLFFSFDPNLRVFDRPEKDPVPYFIYLSFFNLKWCHLVQNGRFSDQTFRICEIQVIFLLEKKKSTVFFSSLSGRLSGLSGRLKLQSVIKW